MNAPDREAVPTWARAIAILAGLCLVWGYTVWQHAETVGRRNAASVVARSETARQLLEARGSVAFLRRDVASCHQQRAGRTRNNNLATSLKAVRSWSITFGLSAAAARDADGNFKVAARYRAEVTRLRKTPVPRRLPAITCSDVEAEFAAAKATLATLERAA